MNSAFRLALVLVPTLAAVGGYQAAAQDAWPSRPIRIMVGFGAGGGTDVATRIVAEPLRRGARPARHRREQARRRRHHRRRYRREGDKDGYNALMISPATPWRRR